MAEAQSSVPVETIDYATPHVRPRNAPATWSILWGLRGFLGPFVGIAAIAAGRRGLRVAEQVGVGAGRAKTGFVLGVVTLVLSVAATIASPFFYVQARRSSMQIACASNLRQIALAVHMYAQANNGFMAQHPDALATYLSKNPAVFCCAEAGGRSGVGTLAVGPTDYVFHFDVRRLAQMRRASQRVIAYEQLANHAGRGANFLFGDGHVEWHDAPVASRIIADLQAGQNPPPTLLLPGSPPPAPLTASPDVER